MVVWVTINRYLDDPTFITHVAAPQTWATFPAVVLCPAVQFPEQKMDRFVAEVLYPPKMNSSHIRGILKQLAAFFSSDVSFNTSDLDTLQNLLIHNKLDIESAGLRLTESCEDTLTKEIKENRQSQRAVEKVHMNHIGSSKGLIFAVADNNPTTSVDLSYKWFSLSNGNHYVDMASNGSPISPGIEIWNGYTAGIIQISDSVKDLSDDIRGCRLSSQRLPLFPEYQRDYCLLECEIRLVIDKCKCVQITHPQIPGVPHCTAHQLTCARRAVVSFGFDECKCPSNCEVDTSIVTHFSYKLDQNSPTFDSFYHHLNVSRISIIRIYVKNYNRMITKRKSYFTSFNLFAQLGGVFNVFFGVSVLSLLELLMVAWRTLYEWAMFR
ncbi:unnamed protein product [Leptidea sinapis]|uniref:Uncharacterized protein n=1 Tax=Leptidea sinapis TaxID=189913 RepID=A0A5E4PYL0_9NEOP|nr:unnamed protein product [Leptidea sinapis]